MPLPVTGIIEGFYGRMYEPAARLNLVSDLAALGFNAYIYAPKGCKSLRGRYLDGLKSEEWTLLEKLSAHCQREQVAFGIGLSPVDLSSAFKEQDKQKRFLALCREYCERLCLSTLGLLFDDLKLEKDHLGLRQAEILNAVQEALPDVRLIFCPTYYTFDPILERLFGPCPEDYFSELKDNLPPQVEIFWTGNKVLSEDITPSDLKRINELLGRRITIWDNYPVNDGKKICKYLYLWPCKGRRGLEDLVQGFYANPMNECALSLIPLSVLPSVLQGACEDEIQRLWERNLRKVLGEGGAQLLLEAGLCNEKGLDDLSAAEKTGLIEKISALPKTAGLAELKDFLAGGYAFDPSTLAPT